MPFLKHTLTAPEKELPAFGPNPIQDDPKALLPPHETAASRRTYFASAENRSSVTLKASDIIEADFCHGFLSFDQGLALSLPIGISFDLMKYWDGRPIRYVCCERSKEGDGPGPVFWCVAFEIMQEEDEGDEEDAEGEEETPVPDISGDVD